MTNTQLKNIVESIDRKDIASLAENFAAAIAPRILNLISEEAAKAFTKEVEEIEADEDEDKE